MLIVKYPKKEKWKEYIERPLFQSNELENKVIEIIKQVKLYRDEAVKKYSKEFDKVELSKLEVDRELIEEAEKLISKELKEALLLAKKNIYRFHSSQKTRIKKISTSKGVVCWQRSVPIEKVGLYIPGGTAPLISTVLMLTIPANIAGCKEIILCTPPDRNGHINPAILYAAQLCGITKIFKAGGAQAIAAMAYGTEEIPAVYKIFGPGNQYVTKAKQLVSRDGIGIEMPAGPSELLVIADKNASAEFLAADLLSQAEHGSDSQVILITHEESFLRNVLKEVEKQLKELPRKDIACICLNRSVAILLRSMQEAIDFSNLYAPEHLIINTKDCTALASKVVNAGSVFLGPYSCESAGDYASGTNHTLPTNGYSRISGGVCLNSYYKKITFQQLSKKGIKEIGPAVEVLADAEKLFAHKNAVTLRLK
jgi:histidinol dehydrogenase